MKNNPVSCANSIVSDKRNVRMMMFLLFMLRTNLKKKPKGIVSITLKATCSTLSIVLSFAISATNLKGIY